MTIKNEIVTCRFLPNEKTRLFNVAKNTNVSVSALARIAINEYLTIHSVDESGENSETYSQSIKRTYQEYMINDWAESSEQDDHNEKFLNKLMRMRQNLDLQIDYIKKEEDYKSYKLLQDLEDEDGF
jgi:hypothetical protein